jgi:hypothetical protein
MTALHFLQALEIKRSPASMCSFVLCKTALGPVRCPTYAIRISRSREVAIYEGKAVLCHVLVKLQEPKDDKATARIFTFPDPPMHPGVICTPFFGPEPSIA